MATRVEADAAREHVAAVKQSVRLLEEGRVSDFALERQVHRAIDALRASQSDPAVLAQMEALSCMVRPLSAYLREGRVNAHASARLRVRRFAEQL